ncbi:D-alanine--D-alanine ligase [hydrothermal vent metagenome]|uniref:D-alanine--D-alanine ligase n=1 Tax=hydrothermal vent metagenome TaxID=652676 RepID=A0A3B1CL06_9ZZZZ
MNREDLIGRLSQMKIGVVMGGLSNEREVSLVTGSAVIESLQGMGLDCVKIDMERDFLSQTKNAAIDIAFIALHGRYGEDGCVQGALEIMDIPYTGSGVMASAIAMDKPMTKIVAKAEGIKTPAWNIVEAKSFKQNMEAVNIAPPMVVKPAGGGSSIGISICKSSNEIRGAVETALKEDPKALLEQFIEGDLYTVGIVAGVPLPVIRIEVKNGFYDYAHKYTHGKTEYHIPSGLSSKTEAEIKDAALKIHNAIGCKGVSRSEFIMDEDNRSWFLEINTIPGLTKTSLLPKAAEATGISFDDLTLAILNEALKDG